MGKKTKFKKTPEVKLKPMQIRDVPEATREAFKVLHDKIENDLQEDLTIPEVFAEMIKRASDPATAGTKLKPGEEILYKQSFVDLSNIYDNWNDELSVKENIVTCFKNQSVIIASLKEQINNLSPYEIPGIDGKMIDLKDELDRYEKALTDASNSLIGREAEINLLKLQIQEQTEALEICSEQIEEIKNNSVQLIDPEFVCKIDFETAISARNIVPVLKNLGLLKSSEPNELAIFAIKQLSKIYS